MVLCVINLSRNIFLTVSRNDLKKKSLCSLPFPLVRVSNIANLLQAIKIFLWKIVMHDKHISYRKQIEKKQGMFKYSSHICMQTAGVRRKTIFYTSRYVLCWTGGGNLVVRVHCHFMHILNNNIVFLRKTKFMHYCRPFKVTFFCQFAYVLYGFCCHFMKYFSYSILLICVSGSLRMYIQEANRGQLSKKAQNLRFSLIR